MPDSVNLVVSKPASPNYVSAVLDLLTPLVATWLQLLLKYSPLTWLLPYVHISDKNYQSKCLSKLLIPPSLFIVTPGSHCWYSNFLLPEGKSYLISYLKKLPYQAIAQTLPRSQLQKSHPPHWVRPTCPSGLGSRQQKKLRGRWGFRSVVRTAG